MQYISRAYQYYSGINPATLSGAIDVIVVRKTDENGEVTFSCSPFHVRFGKLQVLRAGEKRVTLTMPDNLAAPHTAPFWMKVGDAGEAFFVLETDQEVPEEMMTSPVISAADAEETPTDAAVGVKDNNETGRDLRDATQQPFGQNDLKATANEPEFLDLNESKGLETGIESEEGAAAEAATSETVTKPATPEPEENDSHSAISPSSILNSASSLLPSLPAFLASSEHKEEKQEDGLQPNPMVTDGPSDRHLAQSLKGYVQSHKIVDKIVAVTHHQQGSGSGGADVADAALPKVSEADAKAPEVRYANGVPLDIAGYHQRVDSPSPMPDFPSEGLDAFGDRRRSEGLEGEVTIGGGSEQTSIIVSFAQDLLASAVPLAAQSGRPPHESRNSEPMQTQPVKKSASSTTVLDDEDSLTALDDNLSKLRVSSRFDRGASEPPPDFSASVPGSHSETPLGRSPPPEYTWDWGAMPKRSTTLPPTAVQRALELEHPYGLDTPRRLTEKDRPKRQPRSPTYPMLAQDSDETLGKPGKLKNDEDDPYLFILEMETVAHKFELSLCGGESFAPLGEGDTPEAETFLAARISFQKFIEDAKIVDDPRLVIRYNSFYLTWTTASPVTASLAIYRRSLAPPTALPYDSATMPPLSDLGVDAGSLPPKGSKGYGWSRWWRRTQAAEPVPIGSKPLPPMLADGNSELPLSAVGKPAPTQAEVEKTQISSEAVPAAATDAKPLHYAKTLRLSSDQLKALNLKEGPNPVQFSVTSSYSGLATCSARIFLWDESDHVVISDIDGTITKSDALGHVFAAIGRDWTHLGVAKLYTDICNNGYKIMYLTSRAIGQADSTRDYLKSISQGNYQLPEGPVIMSPDRLMTSLHREVIMRKPELFKMACLRDIHRLFGGGRAAFYAGFGNRITDAMSYRSVNVPSSRIFTIDSGGEVKMELLELAGYKSSYIYMTDLVDQMFPPVHRKWAPEFTDFNYWRDPILEVALPDLTPPSPALSARSDTSGRLSVLGKITGIGRRGSRATIRGPGTSISGHGSGPSSPLHGPTTPEMSEDEDAMDEIQWSPASNPSPGRTRHQRQNSMPGSLPVSEDERHDGDDEWMAGGQGGEGQVEDDEDPNAFEDDLAALGEMENVPY